jgi:hypothetical protein
MTYSPTMLELKPNPDWSPADDEEHRRLVELDRPSRWGAIIGALVAWIGASFFLALLKD